MLFLLPFLYPISEINSSGRLKKYIITLIAISCISLTIQIVFQIVLTSSRSDLLPNCSFRQEIFEEFGLSRLKNAYLYDRLRIILPDIVLFIFALSTYSINKRYTNYLVELKRQFLYKYPNQSTKDTTFTDHFCPLKNVNDQAITSSTSKQAEESFAQFVQTTKKRSKTIRRLYKIIITYINQIVFLCLLFSCAAIRPSVLSIPYFVAFIFLLTKWSITGRLKGTNPQFYTKIFFIMYTALHILTIYLYQIHLFQELIEPDSFEARLVGLDQIVFSKCEVAAHFYLNPNLNWLQFCQPFLLVLLYWLLSVELNYGLEKLSRPNKPTVLGFSPEINIDKANESDNEKTSDVDENINEKQVSQIFI